MELFLEWLRNNPDVFGFSLAVLIFLITIFLVSRKLIGFSITLLLLVFALVSGLTVANVDIFKEWMRGKGAHSEQLQQPDSIPASPDTDQ